MDIDDDDDAILFSLYKFSASAPLAPEGEVTHLFYAAPVALDVVVGATPTITRRFYAEAQGIKREPVDTHLPSPSRFYKEPASASRPPSRSTTPGEPRTPSPTEGATAGAKASVPPSVASSRTRSRAPSGVPATPAPASLKEASFPPDNWPDLLPTSKVTTRSQFRSNSNIASAGPSSRTATGAGPSGMPLAHMKYFPGAATVDLRYPVQERKCQRTDEEKERRVAVGEFKTRWYELWDTSSIPAPPVEMADHRDLRLGDVFCHWTPSSWTPTTWLWCVGNDQRPGWSAVSVGHPRPEDDRRLGLTDTHRPSWVRDVWFRKKQIAQKVQRGQSERISAKQKGKQRGKLLRVVSMFLPLNILRSSA